MNYPDHMTVDEVAKAMRHSEAFKALLGVSKVPDQLRVRFCWRGKAPNVDDLIRVRLDMTLAEYRQPPEGWEVALIIDEGGGGMPTPAHGPELVG